MLWFIVPGAAAVLALFYVAGRNAIANDSADRSSPTQPQSAPSFGSSASAPSSKQLRPQTVDVDDIVFLANAFDSYYTSDGLDTFLSTVGAREWDLSAIYLALQAIGAGKVVPLVKQANDEYERYARDSEASGVQIGSAEGQADVKAYFAKLRTVEKAIDSLGLNFDALIDDFVARHDARRA